MLPLDSELQTRLTDFSKRMSNTGQMSQHDLENMMKEEKIRLAMEKMAAAQMQKVSVLRVIVHGAGRAEAAVTRASVLHFWGV
jgi:3-dehydroquinate dehydratase